MATRTQVVALLEMRELLERAGFGIRSATRADCAYCRGRSRGTVAFTDTLAFCHRCHWKANHIRLARQLGLLSANLETQRRLHEEAAHRRRIDSVLNAFVCWREERLHGVTNRYRQLGRQAGLAQRVLQRWPECEPAWDALARFYHQEAKLCAALDWLTFAKASVWLESDSTAREVFRIWSDGRVAT
jgi:hypothetical protein